MVLVPMKPILDAADRDNWGVPALNINEMLQLQAYLNAGFEWKSPLILQASMGSRNFTGWLSKKEPDPNLGARVTIGMIKTFSEAYKDIYGYDIPIAVILDHGPSLEQCIGAIEAGFTSIMIDASLDYSKKIELPDGSKAYPPRDFEDNIALTKKVVREAHKKGVSVEAELGTLGGIEDETAAAEVQLTDPAQAREFVERTGCDALAVAIGTSHGAYKFKKQPTLAMDRIKKIYNEVGNVRLVMHGSSSVPQELVDLINSYPVVYLKRQNRRNEQLYINGIVREVGIDDEIIFNESQKIYSLSFTDDSVRCFRDLQTYSCIKKTMGVPMKQIQEAIKLGIRKINVDTDGRLGTTGAIRKHMAENPSNFDQRGYFKAARQALYDMAVSKINGFGSAGHANDVEITTLEQMAKKYAK